MKNRTKALRPSDYTSTAGQLNLTRLTDDALAAFEEIRATGYGEGNQRRSRGVILRSYRATLQAAGFDLTGIGHAVRNLQDLDDLAVNANED